MTFRRLVGSLCIVLAVAACSGSKDAAPAPTTFRRTTTLALRPLLATVLQKGRDCPAGTVPGVVSGSCYRVGPAFITQADIETADAVYDDGIGRWAITAEVAPSARSRYRTQMTNVLLNHDIAMLIDGKVVNVETVHPGITSSAFEVASHENWTMTQAITTAAGIAKPSRPACTARTCPTSTTEATGEIAARCDRVPSTPGYAIRISGSEIDASTLRAAFVRAHEPVPRALRRADASERFTLCIFSRLSPPDPTTPTSTCPDGTVIPATRNYAVDRNGRVLPHLPANRYLFPAGQPSSPDLCDNQPNGP